VGRVPRPDQESGRETRDVTGFAWRKSGDNGGACIEVGTTGPAVAVRDSTHRDGPQLAFAANTWKTFTDQLKAAV
jgi:hypothetical protein